MRVLIVLVFLSVVFISLDALCIHIKISNTFNYQCTSGNPQGAIIGIDEVVHIATIWGEIEISGNQFFQVYKNNILMQNAIAEYNTNDVVRIIPS